MDMKLTAGLAIVTALLIHQPFATVANTSSSAGFSLKQVRQHEESGHTVRRGSDGFLYLHHSHLSGASSAANLTALLPLVFEKTNLHVGSGHGNRVLQVIVDRSPEGMTWVQCLPCEPCAEQLGPVLDPKASPTFHLVDGRGPMCRPPMWHDPETNLCLWARTGAGGFKATGSLARDELCVHNCFVMRADNFGCSHETQNFNNERRYAGVVSIKTLMTLTMADGIGNFSDCLTSGETNRQGFLRFGADMPRNLQYQTTRILPALGGQEPGYYLGLVGVSLGTRRLSGIHPEMFACQEDGQGGCVIDRGTPLTVMVREAYRVMEDALWLDLERHGARRVELPGYGLCVRATEAIKGRLQPLLLHFAEEDATLVVSPQQLFVMMDDKEEEGLVACLAMVPGRRTIIGALQQVDTRFVYDLKHSMLSFAPESCAKDTVQVV